MISAIQIDSEGRLLVTPVNTAFRHIYREAMEVHWDEARGALYSPKPQKWTYPQWFTQIRSAAKEQGTVLQIGEETEWIDVPEEIKSEILGSPDGGDA